MVRLCKSTDEICRAMDITRFAWLAIEISAVMHEPRPDSRASIDLLPIKDFEISRYLSWYTALRCIDWDSMKYINFTIYSVVLSSSRGVYIQFSKSFLMSLKIFFFPFDRFDSFLNIIIVVNRACHIVRIYFLYHSVIKNEIKTKNQKRKISKASTSLKKKKNAQ